MKEEKLLKIHESIDFLRRKQSLLLLLPSTDILRKRNIFSTYSIHVVPSAIKVEIYRAIDFSPFIIFLAGHRFFMVLNWGKGEVGYIRQPFAHST